MSLFLIASVYVDPHGKAEWYVRSQTPSEALGGPHVDSHATIPADWGDGSSESRLAAYGLATAALGARLLRLAGLIQAQQPLFHVDMQ